MQSLSRSTSSLVLKLAISFIVILAVLVTARIGYIQYKSYRSADGEVTAIKDARQAFDGWRKSAETSAAARVDLLQTATQQALERRIAEIDASIAALATPGTLRRIMQSPSITSASDAVLQTIEHKARVELLKREREIVVQLRDVRAGTTMLQQRQDAYLAADAAQKQNVYLKLALLRDHPILARVPQTAPRAELLRLEREHDVLSGRTKQASAAYERQRKVTEALRLPVRVSEHVMQATDDALQQIDALIGQHERAKAQSWIDEATRAVKSDFVTALWILLGIVLTPIAIKVVFYYVLAPLAARRPPICLLPDASGALVGLAKDTTSAPYRASISSVSLPVSLGPSDVLLVHPDFLQSSGAGTQMETQWILDWKYLLTSLAAGMRMLTRIRTAQEGVVVVSATRDPLAEVGVLSLPDGTSFVLLPRNLVGAMHPASLPLRITSVWRIWSLHAWLTLQMRYLVFHGPAQLIVQGCRGVRIESADAGRRINQAATIGWSANLRYMTSRSETFAAYLFGQRELLNDSFAGADGYFVYEEIPDRRRAGGIMGRGLEGMTDTMLKIVGI